MNRGLEIMTYDAFKRSNKLLLSVLSVACIVLPSYAAFAAPIEGCDPKVLAAMQAKAQAQVAYDVAITDQMINKPDSVLATTCFNQSAGVSAKEGGAIFSEDFTADLDPVVSTALENFYDVFEDAVGNDSGVVDYTSAATQLQPTYNCQEMEELWTQVKTEGVVTEVPYITLEALINGTAPSDAGDDMRASWDAAAGQNVFSELQQAVGDLPVPDVPDFSTAKSSCEVLSIAGISSACP